MRASQDGLQGPAMIRSGDDAEGIGAVDELVKAKGFETLGIVSTPCSSCRAAAAVLVPERLAAP